MYNVKFKIYDKLIKEWLDDSLYFMNSDGKLFYKFGDLKIWVLDEGLKIIYFTGLKDIKDFEIYEGDILSYDDEFSDAYEIFYNDEINDFSLRSIFDKTIYFIGDVMKDFEKSYGNLKDLKIIGNIYDNEFKFIKNDENGNDIFELVKMDVKK